MVRAKADIRGVGASAERSPIGLAMPDPEFLLALGRRVRLARERHGLSRKALSKAAEVSERYLAALELGGGNASVILLRRVAGALGVRLTEFLEDDEAPAERVALRRFLDSLSAERLPEALARLKQEFGQDESVRRRRIALIGLRGAGKSTLGSALAQKLTRPFIELDREIEREAGMELSEVFLLYGQAGYRRIERRCLERLIESADPMVFTVGGGIVSQSDTFEQLVRHCYTVWIKALPEEHMARVLAQGDLRPMAGHEEAMEDLRRILSSREPLYARADATLDTTGQSVEESLNALLRLFPAPETLRSS
jgi:XRE family aerobic/anaerobic benzoate catabolism transcriptional regulator